MLSLTGTTQRDCEMAEAMPEAVWPSVVVTQPRASCSGDLVAQGSVKRGTPRGLHSADQARTSCEPRTRWSSTQVMV